MTRYRLSVLRYRTPPRYPLLSHPAFEVPLGGVAVGDHLQGEDGRARVADHPQITREIIVTEAIVAGACPPVIFSTRRSILRVLHHALPAVDPIGPDPDEAAE